MSSASSLFQQEFSAGRKRNYNDAFRRESEGSFSRSGAAPAAAVIGHPAIAKLGLPVLDRQFLEHSKRQARKKVSDMTAEHRSMLLSFKEVQLIINREVIETGNMVKQNPGLLENALASQHLCLVNPRALFSSIAPYVSLYGKIVSDQEISSIVLKLKVRALAAGDGGDQQTLLSSEGEQVFPKKLRAYCSHCNAMLTQGTKVAIYTKSACGAIFHAGGCCSEAETCPCKACSIGVSGVSGGGGGLVEFVYDGGSPASEPPAAAAAASHEKNEEIETSILCHDCSRYRRIRVPMILMQHPVHGYWFHGCPQWKLYRCKAVRYRETNYPSEGLIASSTPPIKKRKRYEESSSSSSGINYMT